MLPQTACSPAIQQLERNKVQAHRSLRVPRRGESPAAGKRSSPTTSPSARLSSGCAVSGVATPTHAAAPPSSSAAARSLLIQINRARPVVAASAQSARPRRFEMRVRHQDLFQLEPQLGQPPVKSAPTSSPDRSRWLMSLFIAQNRAIALTTAQPEMSPDHVSHCRSHPPRNVHKPVTPTPKKECCIRFLFAYKCAHGLLLEGKKEILDFLETFGEPQWLFPVF